MDVPLSSLDHGISDAAFVSVQNTEHHDALLSSLCAARKPGEASNFVYTVRQLYNSFRYINTWLTEKAFQELLVRLGFDSFYKHYGHDSFLLLFKYPVVLLSVHTSRRLLISEPFLRLVQTPSHRQHAPAASRTTLSKTVPDFLEEFISTIQEHPMNVCFIFFCRSVAYAAAMHSLALLGSATAIWHLSILPSQCVTAFYQDSMLQVTATAAFSFPPSAFCSRSFSHLLQMLMEHNRLPTGKSPNPCLVARVTKLVTLFRGKMQRLAHNIAFIKDKKIPALLQSFAFADQVRPFVDEHDAKRYAPLPLSPHTITHFLMLFCRAAGVFSIIGRKNTRVFHGHLFRFVSQPMNGVVTLREFLSGLSPKEFLAPIATVNTIESQLRQHLMAYFVVYTMDFIVLPCIYQSFAAVPSRTELSMRIEKASLMTPVLLFRRLWTEYRNYLVTSDAQLEMTAVYAPVDMLLSYSCLIEETFWRHVSPGRLSFMYKGSGKVRPLANFSYCSPQHRLSLNTFLKSVLCILLYEATRPQKQYLQTHAARNLQQMGQEYTMWLDSLYTEAPDTPLYMLTADIVSAFEKVSVPLLLQYIVRYIVTEELYVILSYREILPGKPVKSKSITLSLSTDGELSVDTITRCLLCSGCSSAHIPSTIYPVSAKTYHRADVLKMLELHLLNPLVLYKQSTYKLTTGISQGSIASAVLFNCYVSLLHVHLLSLGIISSRLFYRTFVDDWLFLTTSEALLQAYIDFLFSLKEYSVSFKARCFRKANIHSPFELVPLDDCLKEPLIKKGHILHYEPTDIVTSAAAHLPRYCGCLLFGNTMTIDFSKWLQQRNSADTHDRIQPPRSLGCKVSAAERLRHVFKKRIGDFGRFIECSTPGAANTSSADGQFQLERGLHIHSDVDHAIVCKYMKTLIYCIFFYTCSINNTRRSASLLRYAVDLLKTVISKYPVFRPSFINCARQATLQIYGHNPYIRTRTLRLIHLNGTST